MDSHTSNLTTLTTSLASTHALAQAAQPPAGKTTSQAPAGAPIGGNPASPGTDNGQGDAGCSSAGPNGHVAPGAPQTPFTVGQIVCGVANEFPALFAVAPDQPTLDGFRTCYINRVIWHLNLAGFAASHYGSDPTSDGYKYLILVNIPTGDQPNTQYAYRITNYDPTLQLQSMMLFSGMTPGAATTPDGGTADGDVCP